MYRHAQKVCQELGGDPYATYEAEFIIENEDHYKEHEKVIQLNTTSIGKNSEPMLSFQVYHNWVFKKETGEMVCMITKQNTKDWNFEDEEIDREYEKRREKGQHWVMGGAMDWHVGIINSAEYGTVLFPENIDVKAPDVTLKYHRNQIVIGSVYDKDTSIEELIVPEFNRWKDWIPIQGIIFIYYINNSQMIHK